MKLYPLFRYVGGKRSVIKHYPAVPQLNTYAEPFLGSAAMFCHIINSGISPTISYLNELDYNVYSIYKYIQDTNISEILAEIKELKLTEPPNKQSYKDLLYDFNNGCRYHPLSFLYLLRNSFGVAFRYGITDGKLIMGIGHVLAKPWNEIQLAMWKEVLHSVILTNEDYKKVSIADFSYIDPPYFDSKYNYQLGRDNVGGANSLSQEVINYYKNYSHKVWIANKKSPNINTIGYQTIELPVVYNMGRRKSEIVTEILLTNF